MLKRVFRYNFSIKELTERMAASSYQSTPVDRSLIERAKKKAKAYLKYNKYK